MADADAEFTGFDVRALERELSTAVEDEARRLAVDDMKKRAIKSAGTYDEFKNLVACAHQRPVESGALTQFGGARAVANRVGGSRSAGPTVAEVAGTAGATTSGSPASPAASAGRAGAGAPGGATAGAADLPVPKNVMEFGRDWRRNLPSLAQKFRYLFRIPLKRLRNIFAHELDSETLANISAVFQARVAAAAAGDDTFGDGIEHPAAVTRMCRIYATLAHADRLSLVLSLLTKDDVEVLHGVVATLTRLAGDGFVADDGKTVEYAAQAAAAFGGGGSDSAK